MFQPPIQYFNLCVDVFDEEKHLLKSTALCQCFRRILKDLILKARFAVFLKGIQQRSIPITNCSAQATKRLLIYRFRYISLYIYNFSSGFSDFCFTLKKRSYVLIVKRIPTCSPKLVIYSTPGTLSFS